MPAKGSDYALKEESTHRSRARVAEQYLLASQRNNLEEQQMNLRYGLENLPVSVRQHYLERINNLTGKIEANKKRFPQFRGNYDMY